METPNETSIDCVGLMALRDNKVEITRMPPVTLINVLYDLGTLDETLGLVIA
jgi:hypothetical protein